ncbi:hypothetical protein AVEN_140366-1 [Araneus ventricosus]|uniref:Uncharacterized protein n=1 Tax=Araneus ventricosus TaxID=182803 RepID=A0A4Y2VT06_ARAVE|nr:hypothetical protein AVEN_140366-1 [Araneus ventricosus]
MGFRSRRPTHVPLLTAWLKALRLSWAANTAIGGCVRVWRKHHEFMELTCEQVTVQSGGASGWYGECAFEMIWDSWYV